MARAAASAPTNEFNMSKIIVSLPNGERRELPARTGASVMEALRDGNTDGLLALCGGCCSCATCHVYVDGAWVERVGPANETEDQLLSASDHRRPSSRLSCQI